MRRKITEISKENIYIMKTKHIIIGAALFGLSFSVLAKSDDAQLAESLFEQGLYQSALFEMEKIAEPELSLMKLKAMAHLKLEQYAEAEQSYLKIRQYDDGVDVSNNLGLVFLRQARFEEAIAAFQGAIRRFPSDAAAYKNLGDIYLFLAQATYSKGVDSVVERDGLQTKVDQVAAFFDKQAKELSPVIVDAKLESVEKLSVDETDVPMINQAVNIEPEIAVAPATVLQVSLEKQKAHKKSITKLVYSWAKARSNNNRDAYFGYYGTGALVTDLAKHESDGDVRALEPSVQLISERKASVVFDEWTGPYTQRTRLFKELQLALGSDGWKITQESVVHIYEG